MSKRIYDLGVIMTITQQHNPMAVRSTMLDRERGNRVTKYADAIIDGVSGLFPIRRLLTPILYQMTVRVFRR